MTVSGIVEIRGGQFRKFTKVKMELDSNNIHIYNQEGTKEKLQINTRIGIFHKKLSLLKKIDKDIIEFCFEISFDKVYQFYCYNFNEYTKWLDVIPYYFKCSETFGVPLSVGIKKSGWRFPIPIYRCIDYLENNDGVNTEGLFRINGDQTEMNRIKEVIDSGQDIQIEKFTRAVHVAGGLIKLYLRDLPNSLIPKEFYSQFLELGKESRDTQIDLGKVRKAIMSLPDDNKNTLCYLIRYLFKVQKNSKQNQMTTSNLCVCFVPALFRSPENDLTKEMSDNAELRGILEVIIDHFDDIFENIDQENAKLGYHPPAYPSIIPFNPINALELSNAVRRRNNKVGVSFDVPEVPNAIPNAVPNTMTNESNDHHIIKEETILIAKPPKKIVEQGSVSPLSKSEQSSSVKSGLFAKPSEPDHKRSSFFLKKYKAGAMNNAAMSKLLHSVQSTTPLQKSTTPYDNNDEQVKEVLKLAQENETLKRDAIALNNRISELEHDNKEKDERIKELEEKLAYYTNLSNTVSANTVNATNEMKEQKNEEKNENQSVESNEQKPSEQKRGMRFIKQNSSVFGAKPLRVGNGLKITPVYIKKKEN